MDKRLIILLTTFGVLILSVIGYGIISYMGEVSAKDNYVNMDRMKDSRFYIENSQGQRDSVGQVIFMERENKVSLEDYLSTTEKDFISDVEGIPMMKSSTQSLNDSIEEYANILIGDVECELDDMYYGTTFNTCFNRTFTLLENSNEEYLDYIEEGFNTLESNLDRKMELIGEIKYKLKDEEKDVRLALDYMYKLNGTYKDNISELKVLTKYVGEYSMDEMMAEVLEVNNKYQTNNPQFEMRLLRFLNAYTNT